MSEAIKKMLAERAELESRRALNGGPSDPRTDEIIALIEGGGLDRHWSGDGWRPSSLLKLRYCIAATSPRIGPKVADKIVRRVLAESQP